MDLLLFFYYFYQGRIILEGLTSHVSIIEFYSFIYASMSIETELVTHFSVYKVQAWYFLGSAS